MVRTTAWCFYIQDKFERGPTSKVAIPAALAIALPPNVLKCKQLLAQASAISGRVIHTASGNPLPIPDGIYFSLSSWLHDVRRNIHLKSGGLRGITASNSFLNSGGLRGITASNSFLNSGGLRGITASNLFLNSGGLRGITASNTFLNSGGLRGDYSI